MTQSFPKINVQQKYKSHSHPFFVDYLGDKRQSVLPSDRGSCVCDGCTVSNVVMVSHAETG